MENLNYIDFGIIAIIGISTIVAFFRGLISEILSLVVWFAAFYVTTLFAPQVSEYLAPYIDPPFRGLLACGLTFLGCLFLGGLVNLIITLILRRLKITAPDRLLGLIFGALRGLLITSIIVLFVELTPLSKLSMWQSSSLIPQLKTGSEALKALIPENILSEMDASKLIDEASKFSGEINITNKNNIAPAANNPKSAPIPDSATQSPK